MKHGARANEINRDGFSAMYLAMRNGHEPVVQVMLTHGANVDDKDMFISFNFLRHEIHSRIIQKPFLPHCNLHEVAARQRKLLPETRKVFKLLTMDKLRSWKRPPFYLGWLTWMINLHQSRGNLRKMEVRVPWAKSACEQKLLGRHM